ncbi:MAG: outer membrane beta-barrel family protein [Bacteroidota bacterium]
MMNTKFMAILAVWTCFALNFMVVKAQDTIKTDSTKKDPVKLKEVVITSKKAMIQHKIDRTVVNVAAMTSNTGANALEVLEKSPGVVVDQNGGISFMGKSGVLILIDGKPTYLSGDQLAGYLKSLPAAQLEEIELMSNPPAKYEASGTAGLINIKTKKEKSQGLNGALSSSLGRTDYWRNNKSMSLNYFSGKVNLFANLGYGFSKTNKTLELERQYFDSNGALLSRYQQLAYFRPVTNNVNGKLGLDYYLSPNTTVGIQFTGSTSPGRYSSPVNTLLFSPSGTLDSSIVAENTAQSRFDNGGLNVSFSTKLDSAGRVLSIDADRVAYSGKNNQYFANRIFLPSGALKAQEATMSDLPADIQIYSLKSDYTHPFGSGTKLDLGVKTSYVSTDNFAGYLNAENGISVMDKNKTNRFRYKEQINAGYLNFSKEMSRISLQAGLRLEQTNVKGLQTDNPLRPDSAFRQHYVNLFPTAYVSYKLDSAGVNSLNLSFGRRIDRPYYKDLNPFIYLIDKYTYSSGNPLLRPQTTTNYELSWRHKGFLSATVFYNRYQDFQTETVKQTGGIFISTPANFGEKTTKGINANAVIRPFKWWDGNVYTELVNLKFGGLLDAGLLNTSTTYFYVESGHQFSLSDSWSADLNGFYISGRTVGQFKLDSKSQLSAGIQKKLLQNKASVKLAVSDIFRANISSGSISNVAGASAEYRNDFDTRMVTLGFSYNFGSKAKQEKKKNAGSAANEQNRVRN